MSLPQVAFVPVLFAMHVDQESHFALGLLRAKQLANWGNAVSLHSNITSAFTGKSLALQQVSTAVNPKRGRCVG